MIDDKARQEILRRLKEQQAKWQQELEERSARLVPIADNVSDETYRQLTDGTYVPEQAALARRQRARKARDLLTIAEAAWVLGHSDSQSLRRIARLGEYPRRKHYTIPWSREDHNLVFVQLEGSNRHYVNHHYWNRLHLSTLQRERLEAIEFEPDDSAT